MSAWSAEESQHWTTKASAKMPPHANTQYCCPGRHGFHVGLIQLIGFLVVTTNLPSTSANI